MHIIEQKDLSFRIPFNVPELQFMGQILSLLYVQLILIKTRVLIQEYRVLKQFLIEGSSNLDLAVEQKLSKYPIVIQHINNSKVMQTIYHYLLFYLSPSAINSKGGLNQQPTLRGFDFTKILKLRNFPKVDQTSKYSISSEYVVTELTLCLKQRGFKIEDIFEGYPKESQILQLAIFEALARQLDEMMSIRIFPLNRVLSCKKALLNHQELSNIAHFILRTLEIMGYPNNYSKIGPSGFFYSDNPKRYSTNSHSLFWTPVKEQNLETRQQIEILNQELYKLRKNLNDQRHSSEIKIREYQKELEVLKYQNQNLMTQMKTVQSNLKHKDNSLEWSKTSFITPVRYIDSRLKQLDLSVIRTNPEENFDKNDCASVLNLISGEKLKRTQNQNQIKREYHHRLVYEFSHENSNQKKQTFFEYIWKAVFYILIAFFLNLLVENFYDS